MQTPLAISIWFIPALAALSGCQPATSDTGDDVAGKPVWGNQIGQADAINWCTEGAPIDVDDVVPEGFSLQDFLDTYGAFDGTLYWSDMGWASPADPTALSATIVPATEPKYLDAGGYAECVPHVRLDVDVHLVTVDGALDGTFRTEMEVTAADWAYLYAEVDPSTVALDLSGSAEPEPTALKLQLRFLEELFGGALTAQKEDAEGNGANTEIAAW